MSAWVRHPQTGLPLLLAFFFLQSHGQEEERVYAIWGDPGEGRKVYAEKSCGKCHAINGVGPDIGPDLGKPPQEPQTITELAGVMWNHAPQMRNAAAERGLHWETFTGAEMRDLISYIFFLRMLDQPGDAQRGERLFDEKRCSSCHAIGGRGSAIGPDLSRWKHYGSPILWAETMWQHAVEMDAKIHEMGLEWPEFENHELVDLIAFIESQTGRQ